VLLLGTNVAQELWTRVRQFVEEEPKIRGATPFGFFSEGEWNPIGLNPCFRFCKYTAPSNGFFAHRDSNFVRNGEERSILTCMVYLNDEYSGGTTNFLKSNGPKIDELIEEELSRGYQTIYKLIPKTGLAVIFEHIILHEGAPVTKGVKYLMRTDVVFKRTKPPEDMSWKYDPYYHKMIRYYNDAAEAECSGDVRKSSELYERAVSIRHCQPKKDGSIRF